MMIKLRDLAPGAISETVAFSSDKLWSIKMMVLQKLKEMAPKEAWIVSIELTATMMVENKPSVWTVQVTIPEKEEEKSE